MGGGNDVLAEKDYKRNIRLRYVERGKREGNGKGERALRSILFLTSSFAVFTASLLSDGYTAPKPRKTDKNTFR